MPICAYGVLTLVRALSPLPSGKCSLKYNYSTFTPNGSMQAHWLIADI